MNKQTIAFILIALACAILGYWAATGANVITETERQVEVVDELFGTTTTEWVDDYQPGLDIFGPVALVLYLSVHCLMAGPWHVTPPLFSIFC